MDLRGALGQLKSYQPLYILAPGDKIIVKTSTSRVTFSNSHAVNRAMFRVTIDGRVVNYVRGKCIASTAEIRRVDHRRRGQRSSTFDELY